mgnify:CR=1 FL=1
MDYLDDKYFADIFLRYVCYRWIDCFRNMDIQDVYKIQSNQTTRHGDQFLNMTGNILAHHLCVFYDTYVTRYSDLDYVFWTWLYDPTYEI